MADKTAAHFGGNGWGCARNQASRRQILIMRLFAVTADQETSTTSIPPLSTSACAPDVRLHLARFTAASEPIPILPYPQSPAKSSRWRPARNQAAGLAATALPSSSLFFSV